MADPLGSKNGSGLWKKILIALLVPVILLFISATFNIFQAGASSKLGVLESAVQDIGDIKLDVGIVKSQLLDLKEAVKENGKKLDDHIGNNR